MEVSGDDIADVVLKNFEKWEKKRKPLVVPGGLNKEWVPLSGIVAEGKNGLTCLAAAYDVLLSDLEVSTDMF